MQRLSKLIFKALRRSGMSAIISKGWGQLGVVEARLLPVLYLSKLCMTSHTVASCLRLLTTCLLVLLPSPQQVGCKYAGGLLLWQLTLLTACSATYSVCTVFRMHAQGQQPPAMQLCPPS